MEESNEELRVVPELYFLIAKFLCGGPLKETAKTLLKELESIEVLPRRLDWEGNEHAQSYDELASQYSEVSWRRLASVCERALQLARVAAPAPGAEALAPAVAGVGAGAAAGAGDCPAAPAPAAASVPVPGAPGERLAARLSLLSESLVRPKPQYASHKEDHTLVRRLVRRELGAGGAACAGGRGGEALLPARLLAGLRLQRRTLGHLSSVYCLAFDCAGRYVLTGADDMLIKVWSASDGRLLCTLRGAGAEITDVCVSGDGALAACGSVDRLVRVWCLQSGAPRAVLAAHAGTITSVHWAPAARADVRWLASTATDCSVAFWTCSADGRFLSQPVQYVERMRPGVCHMICAAWSAGGAFLAAGSADHHVRVYTVTHEPGGPKRVLETPVHDDAVDSIAWAHKGLRFVSGSKDGSAALWTLHATQWRHVLLRPEPVHRDAKRLKDGSAALWTLHATQWRHVLLRPEPVHRDAKRLKMTMVCWDCSDAYVITAVSDNTIRVWCSRLAAQVRVLAAHRDAAYVLEAHPFLPGVFLSAGHDGQLLVWAAREPRPLAAFHNRLDHVGHGAVFDAKWGGGATVAATDSHGHLLLLGLGAGHRLYSVLPTELFFHTDYRPVVTDAQGGAHDEQTDTPPHLLPPPFLVDVEGAPHPPDLQRLVPGRENLALSQLIPATDAPRRADAAPEPARDSRGVWRGEGVRYTAGSWQRGDPLLVPFSSRPIVAPLPRSQRDRILATCAELNALEQSWYRREMRRRPLMINTAPDGSGGPRRRAGRRPRADRTPRAARPAPAPRPPRPHDEPEPEPEPESAERSDTSEDEWLQRHAASPDSRASSLDFTDTTRYCPVPEPEPEPEPESAERSDTSEDEWLQRHAASPDSRASSLDFTDTTRYCPVPEPEPEPEPESAERSDTSEDEWLQRHAASPDSRASSLDFTDTTRYCPVPEPEPEPEPESAERSDTSEDEWLQRHAASPDSRASSLDFTDTTRYCPVPEPEPEPEPESAERSDTSEDEWLQRHAASPDSRASSLDFTDTTRYCPVPEPEPEPEPESAERSDTSEDEWLQRHAASPDSRASSLDFTDTTRYCPVPEPEPEPEPESAERSDTSEDEWLQRHAASPDSRASSLDFTDTTRYCPVPEPEPEPEPESAERSDTSEDEWLQRHAASPDSRASSLDFTDTTRYCPVPEPEPEPEPESAERSDTSEDEWLQRHAASPDSRASSLDFTDTTSTHSGGSKTDSSSSSSQCSDWEAGAALAPPARTRRRPLPASRYSPSAASTKKRTERPAADTAADGPAPSGSGSPAPEAAEAPATPEELPEVYRPGEWLTAVSPKKAPYHPQMGDQCLYFRLGHQRYFEAVAEKDLYKVNPRDKPWERTHVYECELVKVVGIKYVIKPPRVACLRLACGLAAPGAERARTLTVRYHDMPDVIDFLVLRQQYDAAVARRWAPGDRFRCMIDDYWWTGAVLERAAPAAPPAAPAAAERLAGDAAAEWAAAAAAQFLSLKVRWDNGEVERLSPWDLEPLDPLRLPSEAGGAVPVLPEELEAVLYRAEPAEWPPRGDRAEACRALADHVEQVMTLSAAEPFVAPVDLQRYPQYAREVPYPVDLATIRARFRNLFYRRAAAAQWDARLLATNAERFNEPHSGIVRAARLVSELLLLLVARWRRADVLAEYRALAAAYRSSSDEAPAAHWARRCGRVLRELLASADAEPFRRPVRRDQAPDYERVVPAPMDLGTVQARLAAAQYARPEHFAADVRLVFANSRLYNTNKRSRIYSMTVRLSALFEALWSQGAEEARPRPRRRRARPNRPAARPAHEPHSPLPARPQRVRRPPPRLEEPMNGFGAGSGSGSGSSGSEPLAATSRRVHATRDSWDSDAPLRLHTKGKGIGKKSKSGTASVEPGPSTSRARPHEPASGSGSGSSWAGSSSSAYSNIEVLEEELQDDEVELTYDDARPRPDHSASRSRKRRARSWRSGDSEHSHERSRESRKNARRRRHKPLKRMRERFTVEESSTCSSWSRDDPATEARRYESDCSYRPRYSSDDDAPLHIYRQRQEGGAEPGPQPGPSHNGHAHARRGGVSLRKRRGPRRYNEDSEDDSVAAISKRLHHRVLHHHQSMSAGAHTSDHDYFNGHAALHAPNGASVAPREPGSGGSSGGAGPVSISSRGRVRKLTAKARGLLRD